MDFSFLGEYYKFFINGAKITVMISLIAVILGFVVGIFICLMKISKNKFLNIISTSYIEFLRGTPVLVQLYLIYYGLPTLGITFPSLGPISSDFIAGTLALSVNSSAYIAEILRSGIQSIEKGQMEASRSLGMNYTMAMRYVIIPQALKNVLPALVNEFVVLVKESSIVSIIGIHDLMYNADTVRGNTYLAFEPLIIASIIYFILTFSLSKLVNMFEKKLASSTV